MPGEGASSGTVRSVEHGDVVKGHRFAGPVADLPENGHGLLVEVGGWSRPAGGIREPAPDPPRL